MHDHDLSRARYHAPDRRLLGRRMIATSVLAVAAAVVAGCSQTTGRPAAAPRPAHHAPSAQPAGQRRAGRVIAHDRLADYAADGTHLLTVWSRCTPPDDASTCAAAWRLTDLTAGVVHSGLLPGDDPQVAVAPSGDFVVSALPPGAIVVHPDGTSTPVRPGPIPADLRGDVLFHADAKVATLVIDPARATVFPWSPPRPPASFGGIGGDTSGNPDGGTLAPDGTYWTTSTTRDGAFGVSRLREGHWQHQVLTVLPHHSGWLAARPWTVAGSRIAAAVDDTYAAPSPGGSSTGAIGRLLVSTDAGATWRLVDRTALASGQVMQVVATARGTLFVLDMGGRLFRSADDAWTRFTPVTLPGPTGHAQQVRADGDGVLVETGAPFAAASAILVQVDA